MKNEDMFCSGCLASETQTDITQDKVITLCLLGYTYTSNEWEKRGNNIKDLMITDGILRPASCVENNGKVLSTKATTLIEAT